MQENKSMLIYQKLSKEQPIYPQDYEDDARCRKCSASNKNDLRFEGLLRCDPPRHVQGFYICDLCNTANKNEGQGFWIEDEDWLEKKN